MKPVEKQMTKLPIDYEPMIDDKPSTDEKVDLNKGFNVDEFNILRKYELMKPSDVYDSRNKNPKIFDELLTETADLNINIGQNKGRVSTKIKKNDQENRKNKQLETN